MGLIICSKTVTLQLQVQKYLFIKEESRIYHLNLSEIVTINKLHLMLDEGAPVHWVLI